MCKYSNEEYLAQTIFRIPYIATQSPHHIGTWTLRVSYRHGAVGWKGGVGSLSEVVASVDDGLGCLPGGFGLLSLVITVSSRNLDRGRTSSASSLYFSGACVSVGLVPLPAFDIAV